MDGDNELLAIFCLFSTAELKGQMSFSVVRHLSTFHFHLFAGTTGEGNSSLFK